MCIQYARGVLRRHGGVNLRNPWGLCLAEVQTLVWIPLLLTVLWLSLRTLAFLWRVISEPYEEEFPSSQRTHRFDHNYEHGHEHLHYSQEASL